MESKNVKHVTIVYDDGTTSDYEKGAFVTVSNADQDTADVKITFINMPSHEAIDLLHCVAALVTEGEDA